MRRQKVNKSGIDKLYWEFLEIYVELIKRDSVLTDEERIKIIRQFGIALKVSEHYYLYKVDVTENDVFFEIAEAGVRGIKGMYRKFYGKEWREKKKS